MYLLVTLFFSPFFVPKRKIDSAESGYNVIAKSRSLNKNFNSEEEAQAYATELLKLDSVDSVQVRKVKTSE